MPTRPYIQNNEKTLTRKRDPHQVLMLLAMAGSTLLFVFLFFFFFIREHDHKWQSPALPITFWISSVVLMVSSITLHEAGIAFKNERFKAFRIGLGLTFGLGILFVGLQVSGWLRLSKLDVLIPESHALKFIYLCTGLHAAHVVLGLFFLGRHLLKALANYSYVDAFIYSVNPPNRHKLYLTSLYWHFIDVLWLAVFLFLVYQQPV